MEEAIRLVDAINSKSYPLAIGLVIAILISLARKFMPEGSWDKYLSPKLQWLPAVVLSMLATLSLSLQSDEDALTLLVKVLYTGSAAAMVAIGAHRVTKDVKRDVPATKVELEPSVVKSAVLKDDE